MPYTDAFKAQMVRRLMGPPGISANALAKEVGVSQAQLSRWLQRARTVTAMVDEKKAPPPPKQWTPAEKIRVLAAAEGIKGEALGALLRREGIHEEQLRGWREAAAVALGAEAAAPGGTKAQGKRGVAEAKKRVKELERELRRKDKALAEAAAMLLLEKKLQEMGWDDGGGSTGGRNDD